MKQLVLFSAMGVAASFAPVAGAQELGRVISSTPVIQQVAVPRQVCNTQPVAVQQPSSGGGAVVGAIVGGLLGNTIGHGMGRAAATGAGILAGAAVGDSLEGRNSYAQPVQQCTTQTFYENRNVGYNVQYEYAGKQYNVQLPYDPGPTIRLQLTPVGAGAAAPDTAGAPAGPGPAAPVIVAPPVVQAAGQPVAHIIATPSAYPASYAPAYYAPAYYAPAYYGGPYYRAPYYAPIGLSLNFGWSGGHHGHRHWR
jgi:uncharacterized protein YcfJ